RVVPILTAKHSLEFCVSYAERARQNGFPALVVLGGDRRVGAPRCVEHAWQLRQLLRERDRTLALGGWANPNEGAERQADYLAAPDFHAEFYLTQIVSHHNQRPVAEFLNAADRRGVSLPGVFGVFYYRSANPATLDVLKSFLPVPVEGLTREFASGASADEICARTIRAMMDTGARHFYISNLPLGRAPAALAAIRERVGVTA